MEFFELNRMWRWWKSEIIGLIPHDDVRRSASRAATVEIHLGEDGAELCRKPRLYWALPHSKPVTLNSAMAELRGGDRIVLTVPQSQCLMFNRSVPKSALAQLNSILALDLVHNTPFVAKDVFTGWFKTNSAEQNGQQAVAQLILKRDLVKPAIEAITARKAEVIGIAVRDGRKAAHPFVSTLDGLAFGALKQRIWLRRCAAAAIAVTLLTTMLGFQLFAKQREALRLLDTEIEALQEPTKQARVALENKTKAAEQRAELQRLRQQQLPTLKIVEELSRLLPDGAWVQTLISTDDTIRIEGQAKSAEPLIPLLEASPLFRDVKFMSPLFKASGANANVQFSMSLAIEGMAP